MKCLTKHAIKAIADKLIIKPLKNTKETIKRNKITKLTQFIITEVVVWSSKPFSEDGYFCFRKFAVNK